MIKTLRITSIIAVIAAGILFVFPVFFGVRSDGQIKQLLSSPGVIERFKETAGTKIKENGNQVSPLVRQAEAFALVINPPPKSRPAAPASAGPTEPRPPASVAPKFTLVATSFHQSNPDMSLAFIDEPGKGLHWVRRSGEVGHLVIEQIKDGVVVVRDGQRTFEVSYDQKPANVSLLEGSASGATSIQPTLTAASALPPPALASQEAAGEANPEEAAALEKLIEQLASLQKGSKSDKTGGDTSEEGAAALMEKLMGEFQATRVGPEEAKKLDGLGKELEKAQREPNLPPSPPPAPPPPTRTRPEIRPRRINRPTR
jgi:hypothetical protein